MTEEIIDSVDCWVGMQIWNVLLRHSPWSRLHGETSWPSYTSPLVVELKNVTSIFFPACVACTFCLLSKSNPAMKLYGFYMFSCGSNQHVL